jgi:large subunit ribosomal protein L9
MEIILIKEIKNLGNIGEIKQVSDGYARNYLIPQKLAIIATKQAKAELFKQIKAKENKQQKEQKKKYNFLKKIKNLKLTFIAKANKEGKLFAAINQKDIIKRLENVYQINLDEKDILLEQPIKHLGEHQITIKVNHQESILLIEVKSDSNEKK